jgi:predicted DNA-binding transcriptional regulator AlpA
MMSLETADRQDVDLLTDPDLERLLRVGSTKLFELQKRPDFPPPIWLGPRLKRHQRGLVVAWVLAQQGKPGDPR